VEDVALVRLEQDGLVMGPEVGMTRIPKAQFKMDIDAQAGDVARRT
jgi:hypothetical protein